MLDYILKGSNVATSKRQKKQMECQLVATLTEACEAAEN